MVQIENVSKTYQMGEVQVKALQDVSLSIEEASFVSFVGPSGSGKTTILNLIGCLDKPTAGDVFVAGEHVNLLNRKQSAAFRGSVLGFIFQSFNLLPVLTAYENIEYPLVMIKNISQSLRSKAVQTVLKAVGIMEQKDKFPDQLSGGQKQRVAVARAVASRPKLILADEPTANLDSKNSERLMNMLRTLNEKEHVTVIFASHDKYVLEQSKRIIVLDDGVVIEDR